MLAMTPRVLILAAALSLAHLACAQAEFSTRNGYPELRNWSGMPGGMFGVTRKGTPDTLHGALTLSTPIAYSLRSGNFAVGFSNTSFDTKLHLFPDTSAQSQSNGNGTGTLMAGISTGIGDFSYSYMVLSSKLNASMNLLFTPKQGEGPVTFAIGGQDVLNRAGADGEDFDAVNSFKSNSYFAVATAIIADESYVSLGLGDKRFHGIFGSASTKLGDWGRAMIEYDAFNWNYGLGFPFRIDENEGITAHVFIGMIAGKYTTFGIVLAK